MQIPKVSHCVELRSPELVSDEGLLFDPPSCYSNLCLLCLVGIAFKIP
jgi:hypothetical protein